MKIRSNLHNFSLSGANFIHSVRRATNERTFLNTFALQFGHNWETPQTFSRNDTIFIVFLIRTDAATSPCIRWHAELFPLPGARDRVVWHVVDARSAVGPPHGQLVHGVVGARRTGRTGRADGPHVRVVLVADGRGFVLVHVAWPPPGRSSGGGGGRGAFVVAAMAVVPIVRRRVLGRGTVAVVVVAARFSSRFGRFRAGRAGGGPAAVALGPREGVLEVALEADFFLNN